MNIHEKRIGKFPVDHLPTDERIQASSELHTLTPARC